MRIGLVTPSWPGGAEANGIATAVAHLAAGLKETGHGVTIIPLQPAADSDPATINPTVVNPTVINLPPPRAWTLVERLSWRVGRDIASDPILIERLIQAAQVAIARDGIEVLVIEETQGWAGPLQKALDIPVVVTLHGPWFLIGPLAGSEQPGSVNRAREKREGEALAACAGFTAPSRDVLDKTQARYGLSDRPGAVIRNPMPADAAIDYDALDEQARRSVLFVGRFDYLKGGDVLLAGFRQLVDQGVDARLTIAGPDRGLMRDDGSRQPIAEALASLPEQARARIDYKGPLSKTEIAELRTRHAVAVVTSRYENLSYTMLESLAAGAATICTDVGGQAEAVRDGETGLLIPPGDPAALAGACRRLIEDPDLAAQLGAAAHHEIAETFTPARIAGETTAFLDRVLAHHKAAG